MRRRRLRIYEAPGTGQHHDQLVEPRFKPVEAIIESVEAILEPVKASVGCRCLFGEPVVDVAAQVAEVGTHPTEARAACCDECGERNSQQRGENFDFHETHSSNPL